MMEEVHEEAAAILRDAGWKPHDEWGVYTYDTLVMGLQPDGQAFHVKNWAKITPGMKQYSADTPDTAEEAAQWLVERFKPAPNPLSLGEAPPLVVDAPIELAEPAPVQSDDDYIRSVAEANGEEIVASHETLGEHPAHEAHSEIGEASPGEAGGLFGEADAAPGPDGFDEGDSGLEALGAELGDAGPDVERAPVADADEPLDADFTEQAPELLEGDDLIPERGIAWNPEDFAPDEIEPQSEAGPIAYAASDLDALVREKLGRISQIARELKATLQDGWTLGEFASLQNLIVRIDRGESPDDATARSRFLAISERSQAMSRVDGHRDALEAALEEIGRARDYRAAVDFDPETGWP